MTSDRRDDIMAQARELGASAGRSLGALVFPRLATDTEDVGLVSQEALEEFDRAKALAFCGYFAEVLGLRQSALADIDKRLGRITLDAARDLREASLRAPDEQAAAALDDRLAQIAEVAEGLSRAQDGLLDIAEELLGDTAGVEGTDADHQ